MIRRRDALVSANRSALGQKSGDGLDWSGESPDQGGGNTIAWISENAMMDSKVCKEEGERNSFPIKALGLFVGLYAAQAITGSLVQTGLPTVLREGGVALDKLGLLQLLFLPWALKFLWAPIVDRYALDRFGRRRSWLLLCQSCIALGFLVMAWLTPFGQFEAVAVALLVISLFAATQDIATDAIAVEAIPKARRSLVSGAAVCGGYLGFLLGIGAWLPIYAAFGWQAAMLMTASVVVVFTLPAVLARSLERRSQPRVDVHRPRIVTAFANPSIRYGLLFLLVYQAGLRLGLALIGPYLVDYGLSLESIGWLKGMGGTLAGLSAAVLTTLVLRHIGIRTLIAAALLNALIFAGLMAAALTAATDVIGPLILLQSVATSFSMITLYAVMIGWCSPRQAGTDFAILQSADTALAIGFAIAAGLVSHVLGHAVNFGLAAALLCVAAVSASRLVPKKPSPALMPG